MTTPLANGPPRVLMLGKGWFPSDIGGLDRYYRELLEHLPQAEGIVVGPGADAPPRVTMVSATDASLARRLVAIARAASRRAEHADVVDAHFALYAFWPVVLGSLRRKPLIVHFQGPWADENTAAGDGSRWKRAARRRLERAVYRRASTVVTLTSAFRRIVVERYGVSPWRVQVERPGVDVERFALGDRGAARAALGLPEDAFVAVCVRRLVPRMGLEVLLDAWEHDDARPRWLLIAGDGPLREALTARIRSGALRPSVRLLGRVPEEELLQLYRAADVNVVPTLAFEGFGLVVLEAAACGTPSVVTDAGGLPEAVQGAPGAQAVPAGEADALRGALGAAASNPPRSALRTWAEGAAWPMVAERHQRLLSAATGVPDERRLRVVVLDHVAKLSGAEIALLRLLPHLEDVDVHVVLAEDGPLADRLGQAGVSVQVLPLGVASRELRKDAVRPGRVPWRAVWDSAAYVVRLARLLRREPPDVVHANSLKSGLYGGAAARLAGVPLVWHLHDRLDPDYLPRPAVALIRFAIARLATGVVANSRTTAATLRGDPRPRVIPSALPPALPAPHVPQERERLVFGMVGRLTPWKGQHVFLDAFARAFPDGQHEAVLVGAPLFGEEDYERELRTLANRLGIGDRVQFRGFREDVWRELATLDVLVHASTSPEPFGQVVQEGMALALPVIAADAGGPAELLRDGENGLLASRDDPVALVEPLQRLAGDVELRRRLGAAARASVASFAPEVVAKEMRAAYRAARMDIARSVAAPPQPNV